VWRLHRDSALLSCGTCLQGLESISLEVGNQQGRHNDVSLTEVSPNVYPWTTRPVTDVSDGRSDHTATKIPFMYSVSGNCAASVPIPHSCVCERFIYSLDRPHISCSRIGRLMVGIYKSPTDTRMWKLGLVAAHFFSGNIRFEISVLVLCSA
jgi:hypothetical protein